MSSVPSNPTNALATISRPPTGFDRFVDRGTRWSATGFAWGTVLLLAYILYMIGVAAVPAFRAFGVKLVFSDNWDVGREEFGLRAPIFGTVYSSLIGLSIATVFGVAIAIFLSQDFLPKKITLVFKNIVELLAAIPSVVYGLWGIYVVIPLLRPICHFLGQHLSWIPFFKGTLVGPGMLPAAMVLAIMVLPTIAALSRDALSAVDPKLRNAAYGMGCTRWEVILKVLLPTASTGIMGSIILGFGRALGETMALAMLLGNVNAFHLSLFAPGNTLAALIANNFPEAGRTEQNVLLFAGLVLLSITLLVNVAGSMVIMYSNRDRKGARQ